MAKIVTLITDYRTSDGYIGAVVGVLKSINCDLSVVTVASDIPPGDVRKGAQVLLNSYVFYPRGTIHLVVVDPTVGPNRRAILVDDGRYYSLGPDNGVLTPVIRRARAAQCYEITNTKFRLTDKAETFHGRDLFAPVAGYLSLGVPPDEFGPAIDNPVLLNPPQPEVCGHRIVGCVIDIDAFGNLVTNIPGDIVANDAIVMICGRQIHGLSRSYADVPEKQPLAYVGSSNLLEIAVNRGNAANYFGALVLEEVRIENRLH